jgi:spermidine/putrescine transport system ATP-binding protein
VSVTHHVLRIINKMSKGNITLEAVTKRFGDTVAVDSVSLQIQSGEFFSLLGPSGCGKTTTLRMVGGFEYPTSGEIYVSDQPMGRTPPFHRDVNTVFQSYALFPHKTVAQNIAFGLQMKKLPKKEIADQVDQFLDMVRLSGYGHRKPNALSGGEKQRVALARALINHPSILLLDEPLAALDLKLRKQMQLELKALQREVGITFVYVTHDQGEALALSDRIAVMNIGKILQVGTPAEIYDQPNNRFVADFIGTSNFFVGTLVKVGGEWAEVQSDLDPQVRFVGRYNGSPDFIGGDAVTVAIRPERIMLTGKFDGEDVNQINGRIQDEMYLGTTIQYTVLAFDHIPVIVHQQNRGLGNTDRIQRGDVVYMKWLPENATVLRG